jgi:hypothetical protein
LYIGSWTFESSFHFFGQLIFVLYMDHLCTFCA